MLLCIPPAKQVQRQRRLLSDHILHANKPRVPCNDLQNIILTGINIGSTKFNEILSGKWQNDYQ